MSILAKPSKKASSFLESLREFLTPALWKQAQQARPKKRQSWRWSTQPLLLTLLVITWCCGDSQAERFEIAKGFTAVCLSKRRRPGQSVQGFQKALAKLPVGVLRVVAAHLRRRLLQLLPLRTDGWIVFGVDGSSMACPRSAELEHHLDPPRKHNGAPRVWVTALVHLRTGVLWAWRLGRGYNRERLHLRALLPTLPATALIVADAGFTGYDLAQTVLAAGASFLIRVSGKDRLYTENRLCRGGPRAFDDKQLWCWPQDARQQPPLRVRLIRLRDRRRRQTVWLATNVLERTRLSHLQAALYYRWRWESECLFKTYKRTLAKVKLQSRTVRLVHREAEGALLATQLLLAQGARLLPRRLQTQAVPRQGTRVPRCSPRGVLLAIRSVILGRIGVRQRKAFRRRLAKAVREYRPRRSPKVKRVWPTRKPFKPLKPPQILSLTRDEKCLLDQRLQQAA
jgi:Transposase DDE domain